MTVPLAEVTRQSWRLLDDFTVFSVVASRATFGSTVHTYSPSACGWLWKNFIFFYVVW